MAVNKHTKLHLIFVVAVICGIFSTHIPVTAQGFNAWNPTDQTLPWTLEINPAVISFQDARLSAGLKVFHLGFVPDASFELHENHLNVSLPFYLPYQIGLGFDVRYFKGGIYSEFVSSLLLSREFYPRFSLGVKIGIERRAFSRDNFNLVDANDPVLMGGLSSNNLNLGFGAYWNPGRVTVGVGLDHVNRPDIGIQNPATLPGEISAAIGYKMGRITPTFVFHDDGIQKGFGISLVAALNSSNKIRLVYENDMPFKVEASFNLSEDNNLSYGIDFPTEGTQGESYGSHEIIYSHIFAREPDIAMPEISTSTQDLQILEETILRSLPTEIAPAALSQLNELAPEFLNPISNFNDIIMITAGALSQHETELGRRRRFKRLAVEISKLKRQDPNLKIVLRADDQTLKDAWLLKDYLLQNPGGTNEDIPIVEFPSSGQPDLHGFKPGYITKSRNQLNLSTDQLLIELEVPGKTRRTLGWELQIKNTQGRVVKRYAAKGNLPDRLIWDWNNHIGQIVGPGRYNIVLRLKARSGKILTCKQKYINVTHIKRKIMLKFRGETQNQSS